VTLAKPDRKSILEKIILHAIREGAGLGRFIEILSNFNGLDHFKWAKPAQKYLMNSNS